ncbi:MAG: M56 family metallopeptidase, partial [Sphingobacteriales bacterium]
NRWTCTRLPGTLSVNNLTLKQTESIILHELYHIQRNDFVINLLIAIADITLFFNPFARFFRDEIQKEREHRCDDMVLQFRYDPALYAQALLILEKQRPTEMADGQNPLRQKMSLAATGTNKMLLLARVRRMLTGETAPPPVSQRLATYLLPALLLGYLGFTGPARKVITDARLATAMVEDHNNQKEASGELPQLFITELPLAPATRETSRPARQKPAEAYQNEDINIEKDLNIEQDLAKVMITEKVEELVSKNAQKPLVEYVTVEKPLEYTISIETGKGARDQSSMITETAEKPYPYVPGSSFQFKAMADTVLPESLTRYTPTAELQMAQTLSAIEEIDWETVEENVTNAGEKLDIEKLQVELK